MSRILHSNLVATSPPLAVTPDKSSNATIGTVTVGERDGCLHTHWYSICRTCQSNKFRC